MKIKYITNVRIPTPRAQGYAIIKMCSEFSKAGAELELVIPNKKDSDSLGFNAFKYYNIEENFFINRIPTPDFLGKTLKFGRFLYWIDIILFFLISKIYVKITSEDIIYTRDYLTLLFFSRKNKLILELHDLPKSTFLFKKVIYKPILFFVLNKNLKEELISMGVNSNKIFISPSGVDINDFENNRRVEDLRKEINLPKDKKIILYTGQFYSWKGAQTLAEAAQFQPDFLFLFVGGTEPEYSEFVKTFGNKKNILIRPFVNRSLISTYLKSADVLVLPNSANSKISTHFTSPLKLFEYMAAKKPIVASRLPSIEEVINNTDCVYYAEADDPKSFSRSIYEALNDNNSSEKVNVAYRIARENSWQSRAEKILKIINEYGKAS